MPRFEMAASEIYPPRTVPAVRVGPPHPAGGPPDLCTVEVFADELRQKQGGVETVVGEHSGSCVHVRSPNMWFCHAGWHLTEVEVGSSKKKMTGTLVSGGLLDYDDLPEFVVAIFGGTDDFKGVVGEIRGEYVAPTTAYEVEFKIVP